jgi:putative FmdB family regulatory protein
MPIFEYHCGKCGHDFEELVFNRDEKVPCPKCRSRKVGKRMSSFSRGGRSGGSADLGASSGGGGHSCGSCSGGSCSTCH